MGRLRGLNVSKIEWQIGSPYGPGYTYNPITGCTWASPGCDRCYAKSCYRRFNKTPFSQIQFHPERLKAPLLLKRPSFIFVSSMGDLFHKDVPFEWIDRVMDVIAMAKWHKFIILTKRPERMKEYISETLGVRLKLLYNLMLGVSVENQKMADKRIPILLETPAWKRVVSLEPLIGAVDLREIELPIDGRYKSVNHIMGYHINALTTHDDDHYYNRHQALDWVILGAETGPGARPMNLDWARSVRDECSAAGVPFFFKKDSDGNVTLDGVEHKEFAR